MGRPNLSRRDLLLRLGQIGGGAVTLDMLCQSEALAGSTEPPAMKGGRAKACILIYLWGGPPQQDMWDLKPEAPPGIRSEFKAISTTVPGIELCDQMPLVARHTDKMAIVRSVTHKSNDHVPSVYYTLTGRIDPRLNGAPRQRQRSDFPTLGSVVARFSPQGNLPATVTVPNPIGHGGVTYSGTYAGFLGSRYDPLELKAPSGTDNPPSSNLELPADVNVRRLLGRFSLLEQIERGERSLAASGTPAGFGAYREQALRMLATPRAKGAFKVEQEPDGVRDRYGRNDYGESFLLARRLVEAGVRLVTVVWYYVDPKGTVMNVWDSHGGPAASAAKWLKRNYCLPPLDRAYSALLDDLSTRGLLDETLVAMYGEFGRTPKLNKFGGRDHWGACQSVVFAGGGIRGGQIYGASDSHAAYPREHAASPQDVVATIHCALGLRPGLEIHDRNGRPFRISEGQPITALFG